MSEAKQLNGSHTVKTRLGSLTPEEFVSLIDGVCLAIEEADLPFHGGINAANISLDEAGNVTLGEALEEGEVKYTADQIEFVAPEQFWDNKRSTQADVYSIGMIMYAWSNGGCLPFLFPNASPSDRAEALRRKMSGERFELTNVSETLNRIIDKATAFKADRRYTSVSQLHEAFQLFREEVEAEGGAAAITEKMDALKQQQVQEAAMMAEILAAAEAATAAKGNGSVPTKTKKRTAAAAPAKQEEKKKMSLRPLIAVLLIAAILMVAAVAMQFAAENTTLNNDGTTPNIGTDVTPVVPTADPNATPDITPFIETTPQSNLGADPNASPAVTPDLLPTDPTPTPSIAPIVTIDTSKYSVVKSNVSWNTAANNCQANGGHLVTINNKDEFAGLCALAEKNGLEAVWVGGFRKSGNIVWLNGETSDYIPWANGEPSYRDGNGNQENFLLLVKNNGIWEYKDAIDDPSAQYSGVIGYIMER